MAELNTDVRFVRGVGEARAKSLAKLGITDLKSLISYFPRAYEDRRESRRIAELQVGERACVTAMVASEPKLSRIRKGLELVKLRVVDESAALELTYFNQSYLKNTFHVGESYTFYGTVEGTLLRRTMTNPAFEREGLHAVTGCIVPVYPLTAGVGQSLLHRAIRQGLDEGADRLPDLLPAELRRQHGLCDVRYAYENIHFPADDAALAAARRRLAFEELYFLTLGLRLLRARRTTVKGKTCAAVDMTPFFGALPFSLTGAQARAVDDILRDMTAERPMNRLVQGDVGSGKTMVAAAGIYFAAKNGLQAALMAPTALSHARAAAGKAWRALRAADGLDQGENAAVDLRAARGGGDRPCHRHARAALAGHFVSEPRAGRDRRAAPLRREPARGAGSQG